MTIEGYVEAVLKNNPEFVAEMDEFIEKEFGDKIRETKETFEKRLETARNNWISRHGEEVYLANEQYIRDRIEITTPRYGYIKSIELEGDRFEVQYDLLTGRWDMVPV